MKLYALGIAGLLAGIAPAQEAADLFASKVQPALKQQCLGCHGEGDTFAKLDLRSREAMLRGGQRGPAVVPGDASKSLLIATLEHRGELKMPPDKDNKKLPAELIEAFRRWIDGGAPWTERSADTKGNYKPEDVWAFQPLKRVTTPPGGIDGFVATKLREKNLEPSPPADRVTLLRRATFDLTGLPPSPEEVDAFVNDRSPDAFGKVVERLLESPRYGERWGRHWLDVVRYADSDGYSNDYERPNAWRYRDYVIRSFNQDKPYNQFIVEQIAGDELDPNDPEKAVATGFLRMGPWEHTSMAVAAVTRQLFLDDVTHSTATTFLGLTLGCARCHDHKFDPIPTRDYYSLQAVFADTHFALRRAPFLRAEQKPEFEAGRARMLELVQRTEAKLEEYDEHVRRALVKKHGVARVEDLPAEVLKEGLRKKEGLPPEEFERWKAYRKRRDIYLRWVGRYKPLAFAFSDEPEDPKEKREAPAETHILVGGNLRTPSEKVAPRVLSAVLRYSGPAAEIPQATGRRLALARWIADPSNPLTARVMVNRIWHYHFGQGLAATPNNLGKMGKRPTHPELLDWLASRFIESGWSVKEMHREILLSATYQRGGQHPNNDQIKRLDPDNQLLSYFPPRRLEAETLRDSILAVSGELSLDTGGPGTFPEINEDVANQPMHIMGTLAPAWRPSPTRRERNRRTIYTHQKRSLVDPMIEVFDGPSLAESCERRRASTVPTQAFALFNSRFAHDMALAFAARLQKSAPDRRAQVDHAFHLAFGRLPSDRERALALAHLEKMTEHHRAAAAPAKASRHPLVRSITSELTGTEVEIREDEEPAEYEPNLQPDQVGPATRALGDLALVLFNSNEFVYVY